MLLLASCSPTEIQLVGPASTEPAASAAQPASPRDATPQLPPGVLWQEHFSGTSLTWQAPLGQSADVIAEIFHIESESDQRFLRVFHDARPDRPRALRRAAHLGKSFQDAPIPLSKIASLRWRWRVRQHPMVEEDPWLDLGASLYVIVKQPGLLGGGKGLKLGWLAKPGAEGTRQEGIPQIALRSEPASDTWRQESVDLCQLYTRAYGGCDGPDDAIRYIGVLSDADNTRSIAAADYAEFTLTGR